MKTFFLSACLAVALCGGGCSSTAKVTPKPDAAPVITSNQATRKNIKDTRAHIKKSQEITVAEGESLKEVEKALDELLK